MNSDGSIILAGGSDAFGQPGWARAYDAADGTLLWQVDLLAEGGINQFVNSQQPFARATPWILAIPVGRADIGMLCLVRSAVPADERSSTSLR